MLQRVDVPSCLKAGAGGCVLEGNGTPLDSGHRIVKRSSSRERAALFLAHRFAAGGTVKKHWYVVANRAGMRVFEQSGLEPSARLIETIDNPEGRLMVREIVSDQPGIAEASKLFGGSAVGDEQGPKRRIEDAFAHKIAAFLDHHAHRGDFDSAVLIAEHHILGRIRSLLGPPSIHKIRTSLPKDYGYMTDPEVIERLKPLLTVRDEIRPTA